MKLKAQPFAWAFIYFVDINTPFLALIGFTDLHPNECNLLDNNKKQNIDQIL